MFCRRFSQPRFDFTDGLGFISCYDKLTIKWNGMKDLIIEVSTQLMRNNISADKSCSL